MNARIAVALLCLGSACLGPVEEGGEGDEMGLSCTPDGDGGCVVPPRCGDGGCAVVPSGCGGGTGGGGPTGGGANGGGPTGFLDAGNSCWAPPRCDGGAVGLDGGCSPPSRPNPCDGGISDGDGGCWVPGRCDGGAVNGGGHCSTPMPCDGGHLDADGGCAGPGDCDGGARDADGGCSVPDDCDGGPRDADGGCAGPIDAGSGPPNTCDGGAVDADGGCAPQVQQFCETSPCASDFRGPDGGLVYGLCGSMILGPGCSCEKDPSGSYRPFCTGGCAPGAGPRCLSFNCGTIHCGSTTQCAQPGVCL